MISRSLKKERFFFEKINSWKKFSSKGFSFTQVTFRLSLVIKTKKNYK
jgi:hypothetical protein